MEDEINTKYVMELALKVGTVLEGEKASDIVPALSFLIGHSIYEMSNSTAHRNQIIKATFEMILKMVAVNQSMEEQEVLQ